jgi:hypothetical protein
MVAGRVGKRARVPFFVADTRRPGRREGLLLDINVESRLMAEMSTKL